MKFTHLMTSDFLGAFDHNEGTNKKIRKHQSFKEY